MELWFRTALCIFGLIGCLQAASIVDFRFTALQKLTCNENVTFRSPKKASESCLVETIKDEMNKVHTSCECDKYCKYTIITSAEALKRLPVSTQDKKSSDCRKEAEGSLKFHDFLEEYKSVVQDINTKANPEP